VNATRDEEIDVYKTGMDSALIQLDALRKV